MGLTARNTGVALPRRSDQPVPGRQRTSRGSARRAAHLRGPARPRRIDASTRPHTRRLRRGCRRTRRAARTGTPGADRQLPRGPFALACAAAGIARALALVSASDEVAAPAVTDALSPHLRDLVDLVATDPDGATAVLRRFDADAMWDLVLTGAPPCDRAVYRTCSFEQAYRTALREGFAQGPEGYVRDTLLAMSRWPIPLAHIGIPVDVWYGEEDA